MVVAVSAIAGGVVYTGYKAIAGGSVSSSTIPVNKTSSKAQGTTVSEALMQALANIQAQVNALSSNASGSNATPTFILNPPTTSNVGTPKNISSPTGVTGNLLKLISSSGAVPLTLSSNTTNSGGGGGGGGGGGSSGGVIQSAPIQTSSNINSQSTSLVDLIASGRAYSPVSTSGSSIQTSSPVSSSITPSQNIVKYNNVVTSSKV